MHSFWDVKWERSTPEHQIPFLHSQLTMKQDLKSKGIYLNKFHSSLWHISQRNKVSRTMWKNQNTLITKAEVPILLFTALHNRKPQVKRQV